MIIFLKGFMGKWGLVPIDKYRHMLVMGTLRRASYRWPPRNEAMREAKISRGIYKCAACKGEFRRKDVQMDHREPVVDPKSGFIGWESYIERLLPDRCGWQCLCRPCHNSKSKAENAERRANKKRTKR